MKRSKIGCEAERAEMGEEAMEELDPFERGTHTFTGVVKAWGSGVAELVTDSGLVLFLDTHNHPTVAPGTRITVTTRKYRPCYKVMRVGLA